MASDKIGMIYFQIEDVSKTVI